MKYNRKKMVPFAGDMEKHAQFKVKTTELWSYRKLCHIRTKEKETVIS